MGCIRLIGGKRLLLVVFDKFWKQRRVFTIEGLSSGVLLTPHYARVNKRAQPLRDAANKWCLNPTSNIFAQFISVLHPYPGLDITTMNWFSIG